MNSYVSHPLITGSLGFDYIMNFSGKFADRIMADKIHQISMSLLVDSMEKQFGGTAGNIAYTLKLLGLDPLIVAPAGNDFTPYAQFLQQKGVDRSGIVVHKDVPTGSYFVITDQQNNQIGAFYKGATDRAKDIKLNTFIAEDESRFVVLSPTEPTAMNQYVQICKKKNSRYIYDPAFQVGAFSADELRAGIESAEILIGNDYEISFIEKKLEISHQDLTEMAKIVITTKGGEGSVIESENQKFEIAVAKAEAVIDPTGAGDAYRGGFLAGYLQGKSLEVCGKMGAVAAVYTVEKYGTVTHTYTQQEFEKRYKENFGNNS
ncbi:MAG: Adenosine kinase [Microgenomates group bacterium GW2011_GWF2_45_18]|nr:MAG: Adenosine kinase [Microgenomates group bacterium GW2011_GWF1_44_10]KKU01622.1 MAG: Adenosine kinase [Microgenomates group bacterium GW2011_GWF2_45_18]OGJ41350.1 MAG: hypothetical protein A2378_03135 [Candidatus Pacebacteria bacterium RIFOXYB1_FULL_44_10]HAU99496.1 carbohydrate kinase family protein [Candidatus Paceibacterota bacterium]HAX01307.1 carbohydrate kinase family protein [Candidatus Paceibacterota bacterium]